MDRDESALHRARRALFVAGVRRGHLTVDEIDRALPPNTMSSSERWLLFYSLNATGVEIWLDEAGAPGSNAEPYAESA